MKEYEQLSLPKAMDRVSDRAYDVSLLLKMDLTTAELREVEAILARMHKTVQSAVKAMEFVDKLHESSGMN